MTPLAARDEMLGVFNTAWTGTGFPVVWSDVPGSPPSAETPWARVTLRHVDGAQRTLSDAAGSRSYTATGTIWVQLFIPIGQGLTQAYPLAKTVLDAYRSANGLVWYRNARLKELPDDGAFSRINCLIDFSYDEP
jgi:hypothetical protein